MTEEVRDLNGFRVVFEPGKEEQMRVYEATQDDFGLPYYARRWDTLNEDSKLFRELLLKMLKQ